MLKYMASFQSVLNNLKKHNYQSVRLHEFNKEKKSFKRSFASISCEKIGKENDKKKKLRILIAGGGIAGLVLALAAKNRGFEVRVFEKDLSSVRGEGKHRGPIQLLSSALSALEAIDKDVAIQIMEASCVTGNKNNGLADGYTGEWFCKLDFLTPALEKGLPITRLICRIELQRLLLNAVGDETVFNNSKVVNFANDANKVTVFLENGEQYEGDVLVGADGIWSMVRSKLFGYQKPKHSNFTCYTGVTDIDPKYTDYSIGYKIFLGLNQYLTALDIGNGKMQWYAFVREALNSHDPSSLDSKKKMKKKFKNWCNEVVTFISKTQEEMILKRPSHDRDMITCWGKGRVILLGDAAHPILPNLGHGGSMAIEDCYCLIVELQAVGKKQSKSDISSHEIATALERFVKKRIFRISRMHRLSRLASEMTSYYQPHIEIGSLPLFHPSNLQVKNPGVWFGQKLLHVFMPKFLDWVITGGQVPR